MYLFSTTDTYFPISKWYRLLYQYAIILNLLRNSRVRPALSAYAYLFGPCDFNKYPMAPPGTHIIVHDKPCNRTSCGHHVTLGWYIGPYLEYYSFMQCYMPATGIVIITDTLQYIPKAFAFPIITTKYYLQQAIGDIIAITKNPLRYFLYCCMVMQQKNVINHISHIFHRSTYQPRL